MQCNVLWWKGGWLAGNWCSDKNGRTACHYHIWQLYSHNCMGAVTILLMPLYILPTAIYYTAVGLYLAIQIWLFTADDGCKSPSLFYLPIRAHLICQSGLTLLANWAHLICGQGAICHAQALPLALIISQFSLIILHSIFHSFILACPLALKCSSLSSQTSLAYATGGFHALLQELCHSMSCLLCVARPQSGLCQEIFLPNLGSFSMLFVVTSALDHSSTSLLTLDLSPLIIATSPSPQFTKLPCASIQDTVLLPSLLPCRSLASWSASTFSPPPLCAHCM